MDGLVVQVGDKFKSRIQQLQTTMSGVILKPSASALRQMVEVAELQYHHLSSEAIVGIPMNPIGIGATEEGVKVEGSSQQSPPPPPPRVNSVNSVGKSEKEEEEEEGSEKEKEKEKGSEVEGLENDEKLSSNSEPQKQQQQQQTTAVFHEAGKRADAAVSAITSLLFSSSGNVNGNNNNNNNNNIYIHSLQNPEAVIDKQLLPHAKHVESYLRDQEAKLKKDIVWPLEGQRNIIEKQYRSNTNINNNNTNNNSINNQNSDAAIVEPKKTSEQTPHHISSPSSSTGMNAVDRVHALTKATQSDTERVHDILKRYGGETNMKSSASAAAAWVAVVYQQQEERKEEEEEKEGEELNGGEAAAAAAAAAIVKESNEFTSSSSLSSNKVAVRTSEFIASINSFAAASASQLRGTQTKRTSTSTASRKVASIQMEDIIDFDKLEEEQKMLLDLLRERRLAKLKNKETESTSTTTTIGAAVNGIVESREDKKEGSEATAAEANAAAITTAS